MDLPQSLVVINWRKEDNISGLYSVHLRVTLNRVSAYHKIQVPQKISMSQWSGSDDSWVKPNHPFYFEINNKIIETKNVFNDIVKRHYQLNKPLTLKSIMTRLKSKGDPNSFIQFFQKFIADPPEKLEANTVKKYSTCLKHLQKFKDQIYFNEIDPLLIKNFFKYMQVDLKLEGATIKKYMDAMKRVVKAARRESYIDASQMEFLYEDIKIRVKRSTKRIFLEATEIQKWKDVKFPNGKEFLGRDRDLFLFQVYTGYYYKDLLIFKKDQLINDKKFGYFIVGERDKNENQTMIPLFKFPNAAAIIEKYKSSSNDRLVFNPSFFVEEPTYNGNLKEIAKLAGITKNISNKVARHTNAQLWVRYGAQRPILSKMLGHTKEETTKHYFDVNIPEIIEGTRRVDFKKLGI